MEKHNTVKVGQYHQLEVIKILDFGLYLAAGLEEILLPTKYIPEGTAIGDVLRVFIYRDSEDRLIATTRQPLATANSFAGLRVSDANAYGVFLDWGLEKDLFMPFSEQNKKLVPGRNYLVWIYVDEDTDRVVASARLEKILSNENHHLTEGQEVELLIWEFTELGIKVVINQTYSGVLYHNEIFSSLFVGDKVTGYIKKIRPDNKIDVTLRKKGYSQVIDAKDVLLDKLKANNGFLALTDKSTPQDIQEQLNMSKKTFKQALGGLFKEGQVTISTDGIHYQRPE